MRISALQLTDKTCRMEDLRRTFAVSLIHIFVKGFPVHLKALKIILCILFKRTAQCGKARNSGNYQAFARVTLYFNDS